tara:strand:+ start:56 stop:316 length:261 start_codon:yes stop_codon:yes gene_type:complete
MSLSVLDTAAAAVLLRESGLVEVFDQMLQGNISLQAFTDQISQVVTDSGRRAKIISAIATVGGVRLLANALDLKKSFDIFGFTLRL